MHSKDQSRNSIFRTISRATTAALGLAIMLALTVVLVPSAQAQTFTVLHSFTCCEEGYLPFAGVTMDRAGNLYGTTMFGGDRSQCCGTVFKLTHKVLTKLSSLEGSYGDAPVARVIFGPDGSLYGTSLYGGSRDYCDSGDGCGTVFRVSPPPTPCKTAVCGGWNTTRLYTFTGASDGGEPGYGDVVFDGAGNLYGTTITGGVGNCNSPSETCGVVYKLTPSNGGWTESVLYSFKGGSDGGNPYAGVIFDAAGNLYGTTALGGQYGNGTVYQLTPSGSGWVENILYAFHGGDDGVNPTGGLIFDQSGNLYGTTSAGGPGGGGTVFMLKPSNGNWTFSVAASFTGSGSAPGPSDSLIMDAAGDLYGTTASDGAYLTGSVFKLTPSHGGWTETDLYSFTCDTGCYPHGSVLLDAKGNLYGTAELGGAGSGGIVWEIAP